MKLYLKFSTNFGIDKYLILLDKRSTATSFAALRIVGALFIFKDS